MGYAHSKPDAVKKYEGTYRADRAIENSMAEQIENVTEIPTPPEFITCQKEGEKLWYSVCSGLSELGILNQFSMPMLWDYCNQYCIMLDAQNTMKSDGVFESVQAVELIKKQLQILEKRKALGRPDGYDYHFAAIYASTGDTERALNHVRAYRDAMVYPIWEGIIPISHMQHDIMFKNLWENREFQAILKKDQQEKAAGRAQLKELKEASDSTL